MERLSAEYLGSLERVRGLLAAAREELERVTLPDDLQLPVRSHLAALCAALARAEFLLRYRARTVRQAVSAAS